MLCPVGSQRSLTTRSSLSPEVRVAYTLPPRPAGELAVPSREILRASIDQGWHSRVLAASIRSVSDDVQPSADKLLYPSPSAPSTRKNLQTIAKEPPNRCKPLNPLNPLSPKPQTGRRGSPTGTITLRRASSPRKPRRRAGSRVPDRGGGGDSV